MIVLRDLQSAAVRTLFSAMRIHRRVLFACPTGFGKRYLAVWLCERAVQKDRRVLFVTNRRLLVEQMFSHAEREGIRHGVIMANSEGWDMTAPIQIASVQTLESRYYGKGAGATAGEGLPPADLIIVDEAHRQIESYVTLWNYYPNAKVIGLTATPVGPQGKTMVPPYDVMIEGVKNTTLIAEGLLLPTKVYAPSEPDIQGVKIVNREEFSQAGLAKRVQEVTVFADVFQEWSCHADRKTVCFAPGVAFARGLTEQFNHRLGQGSAFCITADTKPDERKAALDAVETGHAKILVSVDILREGWDMPIISCGIDLQPNNQLRTYWQKIGRVKRAHEGQTHAVWIDMAGNYWRHPHPDEDPDWSVKGEETTQDKYDQKPREKKPSLCPKCGAVRKGRVCGECGHEAGGPPIRRIRMGNGRLREIRHVEKLNREKTEIERKLDKWKSVLWRAMKSGNLTFDGCRHVYFKAHGTWPDQGLPFVYERGSTAGKRKVSEVLDPERLGRECGIFINRKGS